MESIGADPELFVTADVDPTSAIGLLGGSKAAPRMIDGYGIQEDNVLAEFSMEPVYAGYRQEMQFSAAVLRGIRTVEKELSAHKLKTTKHSSHRYSADQLRQYGPAALEFGCDPDRNAYTGDWNPTPNAESTLRTAGGHIHVGYNTRYTNNDTISRMVVKAMDLYLGVPSVLIDPDNDRRELYGKAGAYRNKPYGLEYRTLSNFWIHTEARRIWACKQAVKAVANADSAEFMIAVVGEQAVQDCINTGDRDLARHIIQTLNIPHDGRIEYAKAA
ncbi:MAG: hypothetical protein OQK25_03825 [Gammaproteobacteria bacterium]|nr:hypothetical protein [Gammaproteobacteria bacterium]